MTVTLIVYINTRCTLRLVLYATWKFLFDPVTCQSGQHQSAGFSVPCINDMSISFFSASASSIVRCVLDPAPGGRLHCAPAMSKPISASHGAFAAKFRCVMRITPGP